MSSRISITGSIALRAKLSMWGLTLTDTLSVSLVQLHFYSDLSPPSSSLSFSFYLYPHLPSSFPLPIKPIFPSPCEPLNIHPLSLADFSRTIPLLTLCFIHYSLINTIRILFYLDYCVNICYDYSAANFF